LKQEVRSGAVGIATKLDINNKKIWRRGANQIAGTINGTANPENIKASDLRKDPSYGLTNHLVVIENNNVQAWGALRNQITPSGAGCHVPIVG